MISLGKFKHQYLLSVSRRPRSVYWVNIRQGYNAQSFGAYCHSVMHINTIVQYIGLLIYISHNGHGLDDERTLLAFLLSLSLDHSSYLKAQLSFSSGHPLDVTSMARRNSLKSMNPFLSVSKVRKTWSQNSLALPVGKHLL